MTVKSPTTVTSSLDRVIAVAALDFISLPVTVKSPVIATLSEVSNVIAVPPSEAYIRLFPNFIPAVATNNGVEVTTPVPLPSKVNPTLVSPPSTSKVTALLVADGITFK